MLYVGVLSQPQTHRGRVIDITVKAKTVLSPTWALVTAWQRLPRAKRSAHSTAWRTYTDGYLALLRARYRQDRAPFLGLIDEAEQADLTLCCVCTDATEANPMCHRFLAYDVLVKVAASQRRCIDPSVGWFEHIAMTGKDQDDVLRPHVSLAERDRDRKSHR